MNENENVSTIVDTETGEVKTAARRRRTKEQIAADEEAAREEIRKEYAEKLRAAGLLRESAEEEIADIENENLSIWNKVRKAPSHACRIIDDGPLKGKTDINPSWREKVLTRLYGPYGQGWRIETVETRYLEYGTVTPLVFVRINLYVRLKDGSWSSPMEGTGGSTIVKDGRYDSDATKKATTDAISYATKHLGLAADIYFEADAEFETKYASTTEKTSTDSEKDGKQAKAETEEKAEAGKVPAVKEEAGEKKAEPAEKKAEEKKSEETKPAEKTEEAPVTAVPAPAAAATHSALSKSAPRPAGSTLPSSSSNILSGEKRVLEKGSKTWFAIVTYVTTEASKCRDDESRRKRLDAIRDAYHHRLEFDDALWAELEKTIIKA